MPPKKTGQDPERMNQIIAEARREQEQRDKGYRERALKIYPPICARCGREFTGQRLRELTVHHRDHDHNNNPPDGSNWELLCLYCHDNEHQRLLDKNKRDGLAPGRNQEPRVTFRPFADLESLLKDDE